MLHSCTPAYLLLCFFRLFKYICELAGCILKVIVSFITEKLINSEMQRLIRSSNVHICMEMFRLFSARRHSPFLPSSGWKSIFNFLKHELCGSDLRGIDRKYWKQVKLCTLSSVVQITDKENYFHLGWKFNF